MAEAKKKKAAKPKVKKPDFSQAHNPEVAEALWTRAQKK